MFKKTILIFFLFISILFPFSNIAIAAKTNSSCIDVFNKSFIEPDTLVSKVVSLDIDTNAYDQHIQHIFNSLKSIIDYEKTHTDITQFDRDELRIMFTLLIRTLFLPVGSDLGSYMSTSISSPSKDDWKLFNPKFTTIFDTDLISTNDSSLERLEKDFAVLPSIIESSVNSYYNIYKYLSIVSKRIETVDFNYRKSLRQKDIDTWTVDPTLSLQQYGNYYAALGEPPFVKDGTMLFNHPHLRWTIYILHKVHTFSQVMKDYMFDRWSSSSILQKVLPSFTRVSLISYNVESFIAIHFYSPIFKSLFENIASRWDIPTGMILEQLLRYPVIVNDLSTAYEFLNENEPDSFTGNIVSTTVQPELVKVLDLAINVSDWVKMISFTSESKQLQSIPEVEKEFRALYQLISDTNLSEKLTEFKKLPSNINKEVVHLIASLNYWISANKSIKSPLPSYDQFESDYKFIFEKLKTLSNLNKAFVLWFIAYKAHKTMNDIIIMDESRFLNWVQSITQN